MGHGHSQSTSIGKAQVGHQSTPQETLLQVLNADGMNRRAEDSSVTCVTLPISMPEIPMKSGTYPAPFIF